MKSEDFSGYPLKTGLLFQQDRKKNVPLLLGIGMVFGIISLCTFGWGIYCVTNPTMISELSNTSDTVHAMRKIMIYFYFALASGGLGLVLSSAAFVIRITSKKPIDPQKTDPKSNE